MYITIQGTIVLVTMLLKSEQYTVTPPTNVTTSSDIPLLNTTQIMQNRFSMNDPSCIYNQTCYKQLLASAEILSRFPGIFLTMVEIEERVIIQNMVTPTPFRNYANVPRRKRAFDYDMCCRTHQGAQKPQSLVDIWNVEREIVHLPVGVPTEEAIYFQYIPNPACSKQQCTGNCGPADIVIPLLIYDAPIYRFEFFSVPAYCACTSI